MRRLPRHSRHRGIGLCPSDAKSHPSHLPYSQNPAPLPALAPGQVSSADLSHLQRISNFTYTV